MHVKRSILKKIVKKKRIVSCPAVKEGTLFLYSVYRKPFKKKGDKLPTFVAWAMALTVLLRTFSSTSTSFCLSKICTLYLNPFLHGILS